MSCLSPLPPCASHPLAAAAAAADELLFQLVGIDFTAPDAAMTAAEAAQRIIALLRDEPALAKPPPGSSAPSAISEALVIACNAGAVPVVQALLSLGADVNVVEDEVRARARGRHCTHTPLMAPAHPRPPLSPAEWLDAAHRHHVHL